MLLVARSYERPSPRGFNHDHPLNTFKIHVTCHSCEAPMLANWSHRSWSQPENSRLAKLFFRSPLRTVREPKRLPIQGTIARALSSASAPIANARACNWSIESFVAATGRAFLARGGLVHTVARWQSTQSEDCACVQDSWNGARGFFTTTRQTGTPHGWSSYKMQVCIVELFVSKYKQFHTSNLDSLAMSSLQVCFCN